MDRYSITCNNWEEMPELKKGRLCHSCTSLGENVYVIGLGKDKTIEKLNLSKLRRGEARWELLELPIRIHKISSREIEALNSSELLIYGSCNY